MEEDLLYLFNKDYPIASDLFYEILVPETEKNTADSLSILSRRKHFDNIGG